MFFSLWFLQKVIIWQEWHLKNYFSFFSTNEVTEQVDGSFFKLKRKFWLIFYRIGLQFSIQNDRRNTNISFQSNNTYRCRLNCLSNWFKSITYEIDKEWADLTRDVLKRFITERLIVFRWEKSCYHVMFHVSCYFVC